MLPGPVRFECRAKFYRDSHRLRGRRDYVNVHERACDCANRDARDQQCANCFRSSQHGALLLLSRIFKDAAIRPVPLWRSVLDSAFAGLTPDGAVLAFDRRQRGTFRKSFEEYAATRVIPARIKRAKQLMQRHGRLLARVDAQFGVPATLLMAIWTLESDNGTGDMGKLPVIRTLATLAHDCRRSELFRGELLAALQIVQRGDLLLRDLVGAYAGEIGQTQFLPSSYVKYGVDYDGDGHVDLRHSVPDVLASTANLLKTNGWRAGAPFGEGNANFDVMSEWNRSVVYRKTMVLFAAPLAET